MPNGVKYSTTILSGSFKRGNVALGVNANLGPTSTTGFYSMPVPQTGKYIVNKVSVSGIPNFFAPQNDAELIRLAQQEGATGADTGSAAAVLAWIATQDNLEAVNFEYPSIVTDGLVLNLDAGFVGSYPTTGTTWYDLSGNSTNGTLTNGPTFNSANSGSIVFDGVDDYVKCLFNSVPVQGPGTISFFGYYSINTGVLNAITITAGSSAIQIGIRGGTGIIWKYGGETLLSYTLPTVNQIAQWTTTFNGSNVAVYINGILNSSTTSAQNQSSNSNTFYIGTYADTGLEAFPGRLYNCQVYNRVLSSNEILQNYNAQKGRFGL